ncbi:MAG: ribosomal protein S18-alanine N-acetyltransferase [Christensenellales bacterium]|jgi:ribosomal-protein-alanine N-acetyltransferase
MNKGMEKGMENDGFDKAAMTLRKMALSDVEDVLEIENASFYNPWSRKSVEKETLNKAAVYIVVEADRRVRAYAGAWLVIDEAHITNIAVHPEFRGRGLGRAVTWELLLRCRDMGIAYAYLEVRVSNEAAIGLYKKLGFKILSVRKKYYEDNGEDAYVMFIILDEIADGGMSQGI